MPRPKRAGPPGPKNLIGERVRQARLAHRPPLDQADLAAGLTEALGTVYGRTTVTRLERRERPVTDTELVAIAKVLSVEVTWLLFG